MGNLSGKEEKIAAFQEKFAGKILDAVLPIVDLLATCKKTQSPGEEAVLENVKDWMNGKNDLLLEGLV